MPQTGWGTRAGVGDPSLAMAAAASDEKLTDTKQQQYRQPPMEMQAGYAS